VEELEYLKDMGVLNAFALQEILQNRINDHENREFITNLLTELLYPIKELSTFYHHLSEKYRQEGILSRLQTQWTSIPANGAAKYEENIPMGLIARLTQDIIAFREHKDHSRSSAPYHSILPKFLERVESSLKHMARTGLGLLSMGLGR
jgi:hypothetical protein